MSATTTTKITKALKSKVFALANRMRAKLGGSAAMRKAWAIVKVQAGVQAEASVTFQKKDGSTTTRRITRIQGNYTFKGTAKKESIPTLLKFVDVDKLEAGKSFNIISFHTYQITG